MNRYLKALAASVLSIVVAGTASAGVNIHIYADAPAHHYRPHARPYVVHQPYVVQQPYYGYHDVYVQPSWEARRAWRMQREREWRRVEWQRREARRHHHWQMEQRRHHQHHRYCVH